MGTWHTTRYKEDFDLILGAGVTLSRYPLFLPRIQPDLSISLPEADWDWQDKVMNYQIKCGIEVIAYGMHHNFYLGKEDFEDPQFAENYVNFVLTYLERYPWVKKVNLFNEPLETLLFCYIDGIWSPWIKDDERFVRALLNVGKAICLLSQSLRQKHPDVVQYLNDTCESHQVTPISFPVSETTHAYSNLMNQRRFLFIKLILGTINDGVDDYLPIFLAKNGCTKEELEWFSNNPAKIDLYGLDYYPIHEHQYHVNGDHCLTSKLKARGLADIVIKDYWPRLQGHVGGLTIGEVNLHGTDTDKITWLKFIADECGLCEKTGIPIAEICWYGFIGGWYWSSLLQKANRKFDDFGVSWLQRGTFNRMTGLFYEYFQLICQGKISFNDLPAYHFQAPLSKQLVAFINGPMAVHGWR